jgi:hypothetical protein
MATRLPWILTALLVAGSGATLLLMGRVPVCPCGRVRLFLGHPAAGENSMHVADWYSPSHVIHGILFYAALALVLPRLALGWRLAIATAVEVAWEIVENTDRLIERYRSVTVSLDYYGDSVLNSTFDILFMMAGFGLARVLPVWASVALIVGFEALTAWVIRDGLILNVVMLIWPVEAVLDWQAGA